MLRRKRILSLVAVVTMAITTMLVVPTAVTAAPSGYTSPCNGASNWTTGPENSLTMSSDLLSEFRAGRHARCDRLVFELDGNEKVSERGASMDLYAKG